VDQQATINVDVREANRKIGCPTKIGWNNRAKSHQIIDKYKIKSRNLNKGNIWYDSKLTNAVKEL